MGFFENRIIQVNIFLVQRHFGESAGKISESLPFSSLNKRRAKLVESDFMSKNY